MIEALALVFALSDRECVDIRTRRELAGFTVGQTYEPGRLVAFTCREGRAAGWFLTSEPGPGLVVELAGVKGGK